MAVLSVVAALLSSCAISALAQSFNFTMQVPPIPKSEINGQINGFNTCVNCGVCPDNDEQLHVQYVKFAAQNDVEFYSPVTVVVTYNSDLKVWQFPFSIMTNASFGLALTIGGVYQQLACACLNENIGSCSNVCDGGTSPLLDATAAVAQNLQISAMGTYVVGGNCTIAVTGVQGVNVGLPSSSSWSIDPGADCYGWIQTFLGFFVKNFDPSLISNAINQNLEQSFPNYFMGLNLQCPVKP